MSLRTAALLALVLAPIMSMALNSTNDENGHFHEHKENEDHERNELGLWLASTAAIIIISLCGIFGVLVIPIMQKVFYQHLIQFLVALAIGKFLKCIFYKNSKSAARNQDFPIYVIGNLSNIAKSYQIFSIFHQPG